MHLVTTKENHQDDGDTLIKAILGFIDKRSHEMTPLEAEGLELLLSLAIESLHTLK